VTFSWSRSGAVQRCARTPAAANESVRCLHPVSPLAPRLRSRPVRSVSSNARERRYLRQTACLVQQTLGVRRPTQAEVHDVVAEKLDYLRPGAKMLKLVRIDPHNQPRRQLEGSKGGSLRMSGRARSAEIKSSIRFQMSCIALVTDYSAMARCS
jgi:hypothetical protein